MRLPLGHIVVLLIVLVFSCKNENFSDTQSKNKVDYSALKLAKRPNIVWIVAEDLSAYIPAYGDSTVTTPNISRLAREGVKYTNFYSPSGVCAPSRAAIATGMYPTRIGAHHMRTGPWFRFHTTDKAIANYSRDAYEAMPPVGTHMLSTYLRREGYYCTNNPKEDYQFRSEIIAWDESSFDAHWKNRKGNEPFYAIFNIDDTHESMIWRKAGDSLYVDKDLEVPIPPYLPATEIAKKDIRRNYSNIVEMDRRVGEILKELEVANELDNTIIFWYTDHGGPLPRQKRTVYESGIHVPMIIRFPNKQLAGQTDEQLLSFIDLKPTVLSLLEINSSENMDGMAWMGKYQIKEERDYLFAAADRFDNQTDKVRAAFDKRYKLIKNYNLDQSYYLPVRYRETMPIMKELLRLRDSGELNNIQKLWFRAKKDSIELYDTQNDPFELNNLANLPAYRDKINKLHQALLTWIDETDDKGKMLEQEYVNSIWPNGKQPETKVPKVFISENTISIKTQTKGASIGYQWVKHQDSLSRNWQVYQEPMEQVEGMKLIVKAHRLGYRPSETLIVE